MGTETLEIKEVTVTPNTAAPKDIGVNEVRDFILEETERQAEFLGPTMAINGDVADEHLVADPLLRAKDTVAKRDKYMRDLETKVRSSTYFLTIFSLATLVVVGVIATQNALAALPIAAVGAFLIAMVYEIAGVSTPRWLLRQAKDESVSEVYGSFSPISDDGVSFPDIVLIGRKGLCYRASDGAPAFVDYVDVASAWVDDDKAVRIKVFGKTLIAIRGTVAGAGPSQTGIIDLVVARIASERQRRYG
ncbi:hypothetical protein HFO56_00220 [Rhizobium laguerreae]|uniref:hypothetical protein n=1 Tax=Rhizobium laguerreae TaxID=1076926 RepID=UPI001C9187E1|nr:hypothetical protein [Rhizobium laguerreae]MBY3150853.1 hypothetical protein [Rhizobium laguerreae]